jgi:hypothetical protein
MNELLDVLADGNPQLFKRAERIHAKSVEKLGLVNLSEIQPCPMLFMC